METSSESDGPIAEGLRHSVNLCFEVGDKFLMQRRALVEPEYSNETKVFRGVPWLCFMEQKSKSRAKTDQQATGQN